jgi:hypothetical protein
MLGLIVATRLAHLVPACGEDCSARILGIYASWTMAGTILFGAAEIFWIRLAGSRTACWLYRMVSLTAVFMLAGVSVYTHQLEKNNQQLLSTQEIQPTNDFPEIVIARRAIPVFTDINTAAPDLYYQITPWERCALGYKHQDRQPARLEILCRKGIGWISQDQEAHLILLSNQQ